MEKWEIALGKFVDKWKNKKYVTGMIVCGSYITGDPSKHSDIDIHIILDKDLGWRERGNEIIDGVLIEYFANPKLKYYEYAKEDFLQRRKIDAHMFSTGKILLDKKGELRELVNFFKKEINKKYPKVNKISKEIIKYGIWDMGDNLEEVFESGGEDFYFVFYNYLDSLIEKYSQFLQFDSIPVHKLKNFLINKKVQKKYMIDKYPDLKFVKMVISMLNIKNKEELINQYRTLTVYILNKMGGFDIDGWKIRSSV